MAALLQTIRKRLFLVAGCVVVGLVLLLGLAHLRVYLSMQRPMVTRENYLQIHDGMPKANAYALLGPPTEPVGILPGKRLTDRVEQAHWIGADCQIFLDFSLDEPQVVVTRYYGAEGQTFGKWLLWRIRHPFGFTTAR